MLAAIRQWVIKTMMKGNTGVVQSLPKQEIIEMNVQITAQRLMQNGINPNDMKTVGQVENVVKQIEQPKVISADSAEGKDITEKLFGKKKADVLDMQGNKLDSEKPIMGGTQETSIDQDRAIKARLDGNNKKGIETIKINLVDDSIAKIKSMEPMDAMKEANLVAGKKGRYANLDDNQVNKIIDDTNDHIFERDIPDEDFATGGRVGLKSGTFLKGLDYLKELFKKKPKKLETVNDFIEKRKFLKSIVGETEKNKNARQLAEIKAATEKVRKNPEFKFKDVDIEKDIRPIFDKSKDRTLNSDGGRIGLSKGGGLLKLLNFFNKKSPLQVGKDYLKNVKDKTLKANETGKFMDLPIAEVGIPAASGSLVTNQLKKKLQAMNEEQKEENLKRFIIELENDEFYQKYPDIKDETIASYTEKLFGEKKADGGRIGRGGGGSMGATDKGYQGGGRDKKGSVSGTAPGAAAVGGGPEDRGSPEQNLNHLVAMHNYQRPTESKIKKAIETGSEASFLKNLYKMDPIGLGLNIGGKMLYNKFIGNQSSLPTEDDENMKMAELSETQLDFLNSPKIQRDLKEFNRDPKAVFDMLPNYEEGGIFGIGGQEPTTPQEYNEYLDSIGVSRMTVADGGRIGLKGGGRDFEMSNSDKEFEAYKNYLMNEGMIQGDRQLRDQMEKHKKKLMEKRYGIAVADGGRIGLKAGMTKRAFLKLMGAGVAGVGAVKSGLFSLGKGATKQAAKEVAQQTTSSMPPPYFFKLAEKIKKMGDDVTAKSATKDREVVTKFKEYEMTEDVATGEIQIMKSGQSDEAIDRFAGENATEEVFMRYKPGKGQADETTRGKTIPDEFEANTSYISNNRGDTGGILKELDGVPDDILEEVGEAKSIKYASGGLAYMLGE